MTLASRIFFSRTKRTPQPQATFRNWKDVKRVAILFQSDKKEANLDIQNIVLQLQKEGKQVTAWGYAKKRKVLSAQGQCFRILSKKDINCMGCPKKTTLEAWKKQAFDLVIDFSLSPCRPLQYLGLYADAPFKTGCNAVKQAPYRHFILRLIGKQTRLFMFEQTKHYLQTIQPL